MRPFLRVIVLAVMGLVMGLATAPAAVAEESSTISGTIATEGFSLTSLDPAWPLHVQAWAQVGGRWQQVAGITTVPGGRPDLVIRPDGTFTIEVPQRFATVRLQFVQARCLENDEESGCTWGAPPQVLTAYWNGTSQGAPTFEGASPLDVRSGSVTGADITLRLAPKLTVVTKPRITSAPVAGKALAVNAGTYTPAATGFRYQWFALYGSDGQRAPIAGATGRTFRPPASLIGGQVGVQVYPSRAGYEAPFLRTATVTIRSQSKIAVKAKPGKRKATVTVRVKAPGVSTPRIHGKVSIYAKGKRIKTVAVRNGRATIKIARQKKGKRAYTVKYSGNRVITRVERTVKIKIR